MKLQRDRLLTVQIMCEESSLVIILVINRRKTEKGNDQTVFYLKVCNKIDLVPDILFTH